jgi:signal-transduction protein with cAMP-binding, CBS, and nucleotidyltransferase domain
MPDLSPLERLDSFPYRHRLRDVMASPAITAPLGLTVSRACLTMTNAGISALLVLDDVGRLAGIVTQADIIDRIARQGPQALALRLEEVMSTPVHTVPADSFLYLAIARMGRLGVRHLAVTEEDSRLVGMVTPRQMLQVRGSRAIMVGDDIATAHSAQDLAHAKQSLPALAMGLRADGTPALHIAAVIGGVIRDMTAKACALVEAALAADGWGTPPAAFAVMVLGSAGRGESLLTFDQDNALIHSGDATADPWFAEFARRLNEMLDEAGIMFCKGDVMARNPFWRRSATDWEQTIRHWVFHPEMQSLLNIDIFFDMAFVYGDHDLVERLRLYAYDTARQSGFFLQLLTQAIAKLDSPLGAFGRFIVKEGRLDAKKYGLLPLVSTARARAIQNGLPDLGTEARYRALEKAGKLHDSDRAGLIAALETILTTILDQQLADIAAGLEPGTQIAPARLSPSDQQRLKQAFQRIRLLRSMAGSVMAV